MGNCSRGLFLGGGPMLKPVFLRLRITINFNKIDPFFETGNNELCSSLLKFFKIFLSILERENDKSLFSICIERTANSARVTN